MRKVLLGGRHFCCGLRVVAVVAEDPRNKQGNWIPDDCTLCHSILAYGEDDAFAYLEPTPDKARNRPMHEYLWEEFLASTSN